MVNIIFHGYALLKWHACIFKFNFSILINCQVGVIFQFFNSYFKSIGVIYFSFLSKIYIFVLSSFNLIWDLVSNNKRFLWSTRTWIVIIVSICSLIFEISTSYFNFLPAFSPISTFLFFSSLIELRFFCSSL